MDKERSNRSLSKKQRAMILAYEDISKTLGEMLVIDDSTTEKISELLHNTGLGYLGIVRHLLLEEEFVPLPMLAKHPLVQAFTRSRICTDEEKFLIGVWENTTRAEGSERDLFRGLVEERAQIISKGLQRFVLSAGVIDPLTEAEAERNRNKALQLWKEKNPDEYKKLLDTGRSIAHQRASESRIYTSSVRAKIQGWFDDGLTYKEVVGMLDEMGIKTTEGGLTQVTLTYPDLSYTLNEIRSKQREGLDEGIRIVYEAGGYPKVYEVFTKLGFSRSMLKGHMIKLKLRKKVDWRKEVEIYGQNLTLEEIARQFIDKHDSIKTEHVELVKFLKDHGIDLNINYESYSGVRRRLKLE